jgi:hypothetical protein
VCWDDDVIEFTREIAPMNRTRAFVTAAVVLVGIAASGIAYAQSPASPPATTQAPVSSAPISSKPSIPERVETWTKTQWNAARKEWAKNKAKWADCRKQSSNQKLTGRKSWSFLYNCMMGWGWIFLGMRRLWDLKRGYLTMNRNVLYLIIGGLAVTTAVLSYQFYQHREKTTGIEIDVGKSGISIEKK